MGNNQSNKLQRVAPDINHLQPIPTGEKIHIGNSAYKVRYFVETIYSGNVDKIVSCCDVRLTKLNNPELPHEVITARLEILTLSTTPYICDECGDYKTYYKKCS